MERPIATGGTPTWRRASRWLPILPALMFLSLSARSSSIADDSLERQASWRLHEPDAMGEMFRAALEEIGTPPGSARQLGEQLSSSASRPTSDPLADLVELARTAAPVVDQLAAEAERSPTAAAASLDPSAPRYPAFESLPPVIRMSVRTWLGRQLVRQRLYDEALPILAEVEPTDSIDPAAALFYRGVCYHSLLMKQEALADLRRLQERERGVPVRFSRTAKLLVADIRPLKEDSLDEISRLMTDVTRRLDLGRADQQVKQREQEIIDKLSKLIDEIEKQQQQQQQQQQSGGQGGSQGGQGAPMQDSQIAGGSGAGDVDRKRFEDRDNWGNLPPAQRQEALQQISRDLPTHYREAIEAYFRKLATDRQP